MKHARQRDLIANATPIDLSSSDPEQFAALDDLAERARIAYIVEMDHFIHEKYAFRLACIRYLASRGWTVFGEEIDHRQGERIDQYMRGGDEALLAELNEDDWYTNGVLADAPTRAPMAAMYAEQTRLAHVVRADVPDARWFGFDVGADDTQYLRLANEATTMDALGPAMAHREALMHRRVREALDTHRDAKVALMAGSLHLLKDDALADAPGVGAGPGGDSEHSIGHEVAHAMTDRPVLSFWLLHGRGRSANPWLEPPGELTPARGTVDRALLDAGTGTCLLRVDDDDHRRSVTQMHNLTLTCRFTDQVDALVFVPEVSPLRGLGEAAQS